MGGSRKKKRTKKKKYQKGGQSDDEKHEIIDSLNKGDYITFNVIKPLIHAGYKTEQFINKSDSGIGITTNNIKNHLSSNGYLIDDIDDIEKIDDPRATAPAPATAPVPATAPAPTTGQKRQATGQATGQSSRQRINSPDQQYSFFNTITTGVSQLAQSASNFFWGTNIDADSDNDNTSTEPRQRTLTPTIQATGQATGQKRKASASDEEQSDKEQKRQAIGPATIQATTTGQNQRQGQRTLKPTDDNTYTLLEVRAVAQLFNPKKYPDEWAPGNTNEYLDLKLKDPEKYEVFKGDKEDKDNITIFNVHVRQPDQISTDYFWILEDVLYNGVRNHSIYEDEWDFIYDKTKIEEFFSEKLLKIIEGIKIKNDQRINIFWNNEQIKIPDGDKDKNEFKNSSIAEGGYPVILSQKYFITKILPHLKNCAPPNKLCDTILKINIKLNEEKRGIPYDTLEDIIKEKKWGEKESKELEYYTKLTKQELQQNSEIREALGGSEECDKCKIEKKICYGLGIKLYHGQDAVNFKLKEPMSKYECEHITHFLQIIKYIGSSSNFWKGYYDKIHKCYFDGSFNKDHEYKNINDIMCNCYAASSAIFNQVKSNKDILNFDLENAPSNKVKIKVTVNEKNIDMILGFLLDKGTINGNTTITYSKRGPITNTQFITKFTKLDNVAKKKEIEDELKRKMNRLAKKLTHELNNITIFGKKGYKGLYLLLGYILTYAMIDEGTPTQAAEKNRGAIFNYTSTKIAPDFIKKFGVNFVTEFKDYFGVQKKCHGGKKGGGKIDLAKLDKDSYVFLKKYEIILEYVFNVKYLENKKIESIESFESKLSLPTVQDKLSVIPEVNTYEENTTETEKELSSSPFEIPSEPMNDLMDKKGGKRKSKKKTKKKSFF